MEKLAREWKSWPSFLTKASEPGQGSWNRAKRIHMSIYQHDLFASGWFGYRRVGVLAESVAGWYFVPEAGLSKSYAALHAPRLLCLFFARDTLTRWQRFSGFTARILIIDSDTGNTQELLVTHSDAEAVRAFSQNPTKLTRV